MEKLKEQYRQKFIMKQETLPSETTFEDFLIQELYLLREHKINFSTDLGEAFGRIGLMIVPYEMFRGIYKHVQKLEEAHGKVEKVIQIHDACISLKFEDSTSYRVKIERTPNNVTLD